MPRDASGTMTRTNGVFSGPTTWNDQAQSPDKFINSTRHDTHDQDFATEVTDSLSRSGKGAMLADLAMGSNRITGLGDGTTDTDAVNRRQFRDQESLAVWGGTSTGTLPDYAIAPAIPQTAYQTGAEFTFLPHVVNTGTAKLNVSGVGAIEIQRFGVPLVGGELQIGRVVRVLYDGTVFRLLDNAQPAQVNLVNNGWGLPVNQRLLTSTPVAIAANETWGIDRFGFFQTNTGESFDQRVNNYAENGNAYRITVTATGATTGDWVAEIFHRIEGYDVALALESKAKLFVLFDAIAPNAGSYTLVARNADRTRVYPVAYTIDTGGAYQRDILATIDLAAALDAGTWDFTNKIGIELAWMMQGGGTITNGTPDQWSTVAGPRDGSKIAGTQELDALNDYLEIRNIRAGFGTSLPDIVKPSFQDTLASCQRHLPTFSSRGDVTLNDFAVCQCFSSTQALVHVRHDVETREQTSGAVVSLPSNFSIANATATGNLACTVLTFNVGSRYASILSATVASGLAQDAMRVFRLGNPNAQLLLTGAEL